MKNYYVEVEAWFCKSLGLSLHAFRRIAFFYLFIQFVIWAKVGVYFFFTGAGQTPTIYSYYLFLDPVFYVKSFLSFNTVERFDLLFHQAMHFLIAINLFVFARQVQKPSLFSLLYTFTIAAVLHNAGYWLTKVFSDTGILVFDFVTDIAALFLFYFIFRLINRFQMLKKLKIPLLE